MRKAVGTVVVQPVVAVTLPLTAAVGWGTAGAGLDKAGLVETIVVLPVVVVVTAASDGRATAKAGQVEILPETGQQRHPTVLAELVVTALVTIAVECVVEDILKAAVEGNDLVTYLKLPKGLMMFPSTSILVVNRLK